MGNDKNDKLKSNPEAASGLTLDDLLVDMEPGTRKLISPTRKATLSDLVEVLEGIGAERHDDVALHFLVGDRVIYTREPGTYLVLRLEDEK